MSKPGGFFVVREVRDFLEIYIINTNHIYYVDWTKQAGVFIIIKVTLYYLY